MSILYCFSHSVGSRKIIFGQMMNQFCEILYILSGEMPVNAPIINNRGL